MKERKCRQDTETFYQTCYIETINWYVKNSGHNGKQENRNLKCNI